MRAPSECPRQHAERTWSSFVLHVTGPSSILPLELQSFDVHVPGFRSLVSAECLRRWSLRKALSSEYLACHAVSSELTPKQSGLGTRYGISTLSTRSRTPYSVVLRVLRILCDYEVTNVLECREELRLWRRTRLVGRRYHEHETTVDTAAYDCSAPDAQRALTARPGAGKPKALSTTSKDQ
jgi:hypothetical protein